MGEPSWLSQAAQPEPGFFKNMIPFNGHDYDPDLATRYSMATGATFSIAPHFRVFEFACHDGSDEVLIHSALLLLLEAIRKAAGGRSIHLISGYRTPHYNDVVMSPKGSTRSRHKSGQAADFVIRELSVRQTYLLAKELNPGGLGGYRTFTHVDCQGISRRWGIRR